MDTTNPVISWESPIVVEMKSDGSLRICADLEVTITNYVQVDNYTLPLFEGITAKLSGGKYYSKVDLMNASLQTVVQKNSRKYV